VALLVVSCPEGHRTEGIHMRARAESRMAFEAVEASIHRIGQWVDDPCPTSPESVSENVPKGENGTYATLEGPTVDVVATQLANRHGRVLMSIHLDEREATI